MLFLLIVSIFFSRNFPISSKCYRHLPIFVGQTNHKSKCSILERGVNIILFFLLFHHSNLKFVNFVIIFSFIWCKSSDHSLHHSSTRPSRNNVVIVANRIIGKMRTKRFQYNIIGVQYMVRIYACCTIFFVRCMHKNTTLVFYMAFVEASLCLHIHSRRYTNENERQSAYVCESGQVHITYVYARNKCFKSNMPLSNAS